MVNNMTLHLSQFQLPSSSSTSRTRFLHHKRRRTQPHLLPEQTRFQTSDRRYESESESKRVRHEPEDNSSDCKGVDSKLTELEISAYVNKIRDEILDILDEPEDVTEIQDLDFILEASDDELGLPPANSPSDDKSKEQITDLVTNSSYAFGFEEKREIENEIPSYDSFGFGFGEEIDRNFDGGDGDFVTVGGL